MWKRKTIQFTNFNKVQILWEGHNIWKKSPTCLEKTVFLLSSVKTSGIFFQIFVAFSEKLNFSWNMEGCTNFWLKIIISLKLTGVLDYFITPLLPSPNLQSNDLIRGGWRASRSEGTILPLYHSWIPLTAFRFLQRRPKLEQVRKSKLPGWSLFRGAGTEGAGGLPPLPIFCQIS